MSLRLGEAARDNRGSGLRSACFHRFGSSVASAFLTFDWEIPNCRAILAGVMPALNGRANGIHLTPGQWDFGGIHGASFGKPLRAQMTRRLLRIRPNTRRELVSPFHLLKRCEME